MEVFIKVIELIFASPLAKYFKSVYLYCRKSFVKYYFAAIITISISAIIYFGAKMLRYQEEVLKPLALAYENRAANNANVVTRIPELMEKLVLKCGPDVTMHFISLESKSLNNFEKKLSFLAVRGTGYCSFNSKKICVFDRKIKNKAFYGRTYDLTHEDGVFIENDTIRLTSDHIESPLDWRELKPVILPIYSTGGISMQMRSLQSQSPELFKILAHNPAPLEKMKVGAAIKVRNDTIKNKSVVFLVMIFRWGESDDTCTNEGLKQAVYVLAERIKKDMILF